VRHLQPGARIVALSWDGETPARLATLLRTRGLGASTMTVLERLGGPGERIRRTTATGFDLAGVAPLNTIALEVAGPASARTASTVSRPWRGGWWRTPSW